MDLIEGISQAMRTAAEGTSADDFGRASAALIQGRDKVREAMQEFTATNIRPIIHKLEGNQPLTPEEKNYIRMWIVGDAESFIRMENSFPEWLAEYKRLQGAIQEYEHKEDSAPELLNLQSILEDAIRVSADIEHFLEEKERVAHFEQAIDNLDSASSKLLADIMKSKLASSEL